MPDSETEKSWRKYGLGAHAIFPVQSLDCGGTTRDKYDKLSLAYFSLNILIYFVTCFITL